jgi:isopenicillin-N epimerase
VATADPAHATFDRSPWLLDPDISFLNHGAFGACPDPVLEAQRVWRERMEAEPVRFLDRELEVHLDETRSRLGAFLRADPEGIVFVPNATTGVSTVLASLRFEPGDELLASDHEYNASLNALRGAAARDGAIVRIVHIPFPIRDPSQAVEAYLQAVTPRTRLALVSHVTSPTALVMPVTAIVRELDRRGVDTLVDGAHAPGMIDVDLGALGAAYWTGNGHKWLCAPKGSGLLHVRADLRDRMRPLATSHGANSDRVERQRFRLLFDWVGTADPTPYLVVPRRAPGGVARRREP